MHLLQPHSVSKVMMFHSCDRQNIVDPMIYKVGM